MGEANDKPRKFRRRMAKVPRGAEPNQIHLAGLTNSSGGKTDRASITMLRMDARRISGASASSSSVPGSPTQRQANAVVVGSAGAWSVTRIRWLALPYDHEER